MNSFLLVSFLATLSPNQPYDYTDLIATPDHGVRYIKGVLGYTRDCRMAVYPDRLSALTRDQSTAFILAPQSIWSGKDGQTSFGALVHQYILLKGRVESGQVGFAGKLSTKSNPLPTQDTKFAYTSKATCTSWSGDPIDVRDAIARASTKGGEGERVLVYGYMNAQRDDWLQPTAADLAKGAQSYVTDYVLYPSRETYDERIDIGSIQAAFSGDLALPVGCEGRLMMVEGKLVRRQLGNSYAVVLSETRVVEDTCALRTGLDDKARRPGLKPSASFD